MFVGAMARGTGPSWTPGTRRVSGGVVMLACNLPPWIRPSR